LSLQTLHTTTTQGDNTWSLQTRQATPSNPVGDNSLSLHLDISIYPTGDNTLSLQPRQATPSNPVGDNTLSLHLYSSSTTASLLYIQHFENRAATRHSNNPSARRPFPDSDRHTRTTFIVVLGLLPSRGGKPDKSSIDNFVKPQGSPSRSTSHTAAAGSRTPTPCLEHGW
jgi:hypothetical protein